MPPSKNVIEALATIATSQPEALSHDGLKLLAEYVLADLDRQAGRSAIVARANDTEFNLAAAMDAVNRAFRQ